MDLQEFKSFIGINEMKNYKILSRQIIAEFLGTFVYLCLVLLSDTGVVATALANGLLVSTVVQIIGNISGGHINPAVTVGAVAFGNMKLLKAVCYIAVQILGAIAGSSVAYAVTSPSTRGQLGTTRPHQGLRVDQVFALEFLMSFLLVSVFISVVDARRGSRGLGSAPLAIGLTITACQCACLPYTGSLNPVRTLGPAVIMGEWNTYYHWVYWVGPISGGVVAGFLYRFIFTEIEQ